MVRSSRFPFRLIFSCEIFARTFFVSFIFFVVFRDFCDSADRTSIAKIAMNSSREYISINFINFHLFWDPFVDNHPNPVEIPKGIHSIRNGIRFGFSPLRPEIRKFVLFLQFDSFLLPYFDIVLCVTVHRRHEFDELSVRNVEFFHGIWTETNPLWLSVVFIGW